MGNSKDNNSVLHLELLLGKKTVEETAQQMADYWVDKKVEPMALYSVDCLVDYSVYQMVVSSASDLVL